MARQAYGRNKKPKKVMRLTGKSRELHCMLIPTELENLLLPTSAVAEIMEFQTPAAMENAPPWLLGQVEWENRQVPVFSFSALINGTDVGEITPQSRIVILKSLADEGRVPFLGLLLQDLPRPITVNEKQIKKTGDDKKALGVFSRVSLPESEAIIPDLDRVTHLVTHAVFGALPITQLDS